MLAAATAHAKAEAAQKRAEFAKKEVEFKVERAKLDSKLDVLAKESEAEAAEAAVLESAVASFDMSDEHLSLPKETQSSHERTTDYVNMQQPRSDSVKSKDVKIEKRRVCKST